MQKGHSMKNIIICVMLNMPYIVSGKNQNLNIIDMNPIKFNYPPDVAVTFVNQMVESAKSDPEVSEKQRAVFEDIQTLVNLARKQLVAQQAPAHGGTVDKIKS